VSEPGISLSVCSEFVRMAWILGRYCPILIPVQMIACGCVYTCGSVTSSYSGETVDFCCSTALFALAMKAD